MSLKLLSCLFVLTMPFFACEGDSRNYFSNPKYRVMYYRTQDYGGLFNPSTIPVAARAADFSVQDEEEVKDYGDDGNDNTEDRILGQEKRLPENIYSFLSGSGKIKPFPDDLRPILHSMGSQLRQLVRNHNQSEVTHKKILSVLEDTLAWAKTQAASFYSLISTFKNR